MTTERKEAIKKYLDERGVNFPFELYENYRDLDEMAGEYVEGTQTPLVNLGFARMDNECETSWCITAPTTPEPHGKCSTSFVTDYTDGENFETFDDLIEALDAWEQSAQADRVRMFDALHDYLTHATEPINEPQPRKATDGEWDKHN